jgi:hypothetical protein
MLSRLRRQLTYSNVVATVALFVALGGSGYAAAERLAARSAQAPIGSAGGTAYGRVGPGGALTRSSNVQAVRHPKIGTYCIRLSSDIEPSKTGLIAAADFSYDTTSLNGAGNHAIVEWRGAQVNCSSQELEITTGRQLANGTLEPANQGFFFSSGPSSGPRAEAVVNNSNTLDPAYTRGFTGMRHPSTGIFCFSHPPGIDPRKDAAFAAPAFNIFTGFSGTMFMAMWVNPNLACPKDEYEVRTFDFRSGQTVLADRVTFSFVVP